MKVRKIKSCDVVECRTVSPVVAQSSYDVIQSWPKEFREDYFNATNDFVNEHLDSQIEVNVVTDDPNAESGEVCIEVTGTTETGRVRTGKFYLEPEGGWQDYDYIYQALDETAFAIGIIDDEFDEVDSSDDIKCEDDLDDIDDALNHIRSQCLDKIRKLASSESWGSFQPSEIDKYFFVDCYLPNEFDNCRIEIRGEVSYEGLEEMCEACNPVVQSYNPDAYFEPVEPGIAEAWLKKEDVLKEDIQSSDVFALEDSQLEPPDDPDNIYEVDDYEEEIEIDLEGQIIDVAADGSWEYEDDSYDWALDNGKNWTAFDYPNLVLDDSVSIVEHIDDLIMPNIPVRPGKYQLHGTATLVYTISGIEEKREPISRDDYDSEIYTDDAEARFNFEESHLDNFSVTKA